MLNPMAFVPDNSVEEAMDKCACGWFYGAGTGHCECGIGSGGGFPAQLEENVSQ